MGHVQGEEEIHKPCQDILSLQPVGPDDGSSTGVNIDLLLNQLMGQPGEPNQPRDGDIGEQSQGSDPIPDANTPGQCDILDCLSLDSLTSNAPHDNWICHLHSRRNSSATSVQSSHATREDGDRLNSDGLSSNASASQPSAKTKTSHRLSVEAVKVLKTWLYQHQHDPYPSKREKKMLEQQTGLNQTQLSNWFTNARRRKLSNRPPRRGSQVDNSLLSPMARWQNSPPESEPAATPDILRALADVPDCSDVTHYAPQVDWSSNGSSCTGSEISNTTSVSSFEHSQSSGSESSFTRSQRSALRSTAPIHISRARRRSRKRLPFANALNKRKAQHKRAFQCTFCADSFGTKYDWQRHEKALHLPVDQWCCAPHGGIVEIDGTDTCVFCREPNVDFEHLERHSYKTCCEKAPEQRTFTRKDHLRQHLKLTHDVDYHSPSMDQWRHSKGYLVSRCGFCDANFQCWEERVDHVAEHFKEGADMIQWKGNWGFEPETQRLVENAMPPYLLGQERNTPNPWKASGALLLESIGNDESLPSPNVPNGLDLYNNMRNELIAYIRDQIAEGIHPSDQAIQDHARQITFGTDDPWNQTYADDPVWLDAIKHDAEPSLLPDDDTWLETNHLSLFGVELP